MKLLKVLTNDLKKQNKNLLFSDKIIVDFTQGGPTISSIKPSKAFVRLASIHFAGETIELCIEQSGLPPWDGQIIVKTNFRDRRLKLSLAFRCNFKIKEF